MNDKINMQDKTRILEDKMLKARQRRGRYKLETIPNRHVIPVGKSILEIREVLWGDTLTEALHLSRPMSVTLSNSKAATFWMDAEFLPHTPFALVEPNREGGYTINFSVEMLGFIEIGGRRLSLSAAIAEERAEERGEYYSVRLTDDCAVKIDFGALSYYIHKVSLESLTKSPIAENIDYPITAFITFAMLLYALTGLYLNSLPAPEVADIIDGVASRFDPGYLLAQIEPEPEPEIQQAQANGSPAHIGEEGRTGDEDSQLDKTDGSVRRRLDDQQVAEGSGILGAMDQGFEAMDKIFGGGGLGSQLDKYLGQMNGMEGLDMRGAGGMGSRGAGLAGGGIALGIGGVGTKGRSGHRNSRYGIDAARNPKKSKHRIMLDPQPAKIIGSMDKSVIARIIRKHHSQFRYCYQRELNKNPRLYGKISVKFTISPAGLVSSSLVKVSTMRNQEVESCVARTMKRIVFPKPKNHGIVVVTYPFLFNTERI